MTPTNSTYLARLQARARTEGIELTPAGEPLFARDAERWAKIKAEPSPVDEERAGAVDESYGTLRDALEAFGFTQTGRAVVEGGTLYGYRAENGTPRIEIGRLCDPAQTRRDVEAWFEAEGAALPE